MNYNISWIASTSLSPLPDKLIIIILSLGNVGASFNAYATAWLDSIAGIIPSSLLSSKNAFIASWSVALTYSTLLTSFKYACSGPTPG